MIYVGEVGQGNAIKTKLGLDLDNVYHSIKNGLAESNVIDAKIGKIIEVDYEPDLKWIFI